jgi:hypothetical protein
MVKPRVGGGPRPHPDMPDDVRADYEEARFHRKPFATWRMRPHRLAVQKLVDWQARRGATTFVVSSAHPSRNTRAGACR